MITVIQRYSVSPVSHTLRLRAPMDNTGYTVQQSRCREHVYYAHNNVP